MNGLFYMTCILSVSLTSLDTDLIGCLKPPEEVPLQCKNITVNGEYKYPFDEVCDEVEVYDDNKTVKYLGHDTALPIQDECLNRTMKCLRKGIEICKRFFTVSDASFLSDSERPKQLNNTSEQTDADSVKNESSPKDQSIQPAAVGVPLAALAIVLAAVVGVWFCQRKNKKTVPTVDGALPGQTAAQPEGQSLLRGSNGIRLGPCSAGFSAATDDVTVTMLDEGGHPLVSKGGVESDPVVGHPSPLASVGISMGRKYLMQWRVRNN